MLYGHYQAVHPPIAARDAKAALRVAGRLEDTASGPPLGPVVPAPCGPFAPADAAADAAWKAEGAVLSASRLAAPYHFACFSPLGSGEQLSVYRPHDAAFFRYHLLMRAWDVWHGRRVLRSGAERDTVFANNRAAIRLVDNGTRAEMIAPDLPVGPVKAAPLRLPVALQRVRLSEDGTAIFGGLRGRRFRDEWQLFVRDGLQIRPCGAALRLDDICQVVRSAASGRIAVLGHLGGHTSCVYVSSPPTAPWQWHRVAPPAWTDPLLAQIRFAPGDQGLYVSTVTGAKHAPPSLWLPLPPQPAFAPPPYICWLGAAASDGSQPVLEWQDSAPNRITYVTASGRIEAALPPLGHIGHPLPPQQVALSPCGTFAVISQRTSCSYADVASGKAVRKEAHWLRPLRLLGAHVAVAAPMLVMPPLAMALAVAPQGARLGLVWPTGELSVADAANGFALRALAAAGERRFAGMMWSRDGQRLHVLSGVAAGACSYIYGLRSIDLSGGIDKELQFLHGGRDLRLLASAESRDGRTLVAADGEGSVRLLKTANLFNDAEPRTTPPGPSSLSRRRLL